MSPTIRALALATAFTWFAATGDAQSLGTFRWQLQPFCNAVVVEVTQAGAVYTVDGYDDQCGAAQRAPLVGLATPNPDGSIGFGLNVVTVPGGRGVQIDARISLPGLGGTWSDSAGNGGTFAFNASTGGSPRPAPSSGGGGAIPPTFTLLTDGGFLARGTFGASAIPASNIGTRMMWYPGKAAFRAGRITAPLWEDALVGAHSAAFGLNSSAIGQYSFAAGEDATALGTASTAFGSNAQANGNYSTAIGNTVIASGLYSLATGFGTTAAGGATTVMGSHALATGAHAGSFVFGDASTYATATQVQPTGVNQFVARASGGVYFFSSDDTVIDGTPPPGVRLLANASAWTNLSDENAKENFRDVAPEDLLARIAAMPVREWNYKAQGPEIRHMGPTAQDFHKAFGLGEDPLGISTIDADGVALAAVRALEARTRSINERLTRENEELRARLARLEALLEQR
jgi:hypothetical protein